MKLSTGIERFNCNICAGRLRRIMEKKREFKTIQKVVESCMRGKHFKNVDFYIYIIFNECTLTQCEHEYYIFTLILTPLFSILSVFLLFKSIIIVIIVISLIDACMIAILSHLLNSFFRFVVYAFLLHTHSHSSTFYLTCISTIQFHLCFSFVLFVYSILYIIKKGNTSKNCFSTFFVCLFVSMCVFRI